MLIVSLDKGAQLTRPELIVQDGVADSPEMIRVSFRLSSA